MTKCRTLTETLRCGSKKTVHVSATFFINCFSILLNTHLDHHLDLNLCRHLFNLYHSLKQWLMTSPIRSYIEYLIPAYKILVLLLHSNFTQNLAFWQVLIRFTLYWHYSVGFYLFGRWTALCIAYWSPRQNQRFSGRIHSVPLLDSELHVCTNDSPWLFAGFAHTDFMLFGRKNCRLV